MPKLKVTYNAPVVLTFAILASIVTVLPSGVDGWFVTYPELGGPRTWVGLFSHVLGHSNWGHLLGNLTLILLLGPLLEERHGSVPLLGMILLTALITGLVNLVLSESGLHGASGIVFMMILLASTANIRQGEIPLTFIAIAVIYLGGEIVSSFRNDNISQLAHLVGGLSGAVLGFLSARRRGGAAPVKAGAS